MTYLEFVVKHPPAPGVIPPLAGKAGLIPVFTAAAIAVVRPAVKPDVLPDLSAALLTGLIPALLSAVYEVVVPAVSPARSRNVTSNVSLALTAAVRSDDSTNHHTELSSADPTAAGTETAT
ncbi:MAG: hypothetical protein ABIK43_05650 [candidate division WOR-3 bacterium]